jgi:hypothetical protein
MNCVNESTSALGDASLSRSLITRGLGDTVVARLPLTHRFARVTDLPRPVINQ